MSEEHQDKARRVRERAYALWQQAGCPAGRDQEFWYDAEAAETEPEVLFYAPAKGAPYPPTEPKGE